MTRCEVHYTILSSVFSHCLVRTPCKIIKFVRNNEVMLNYEISREQLHLPMPLLFYFFKEVTVVEAKLYMTVGKRGYCLKINLRFEDKYDLLYLMKKSDLS